MSESISVVVLIEIINCYDLITNYFWDEWIKNANHFAPCFFITRPDTGEQLRRYRDRFIHGENEVIDMGWWPDKERPMLYWEI